MHTRKIRKNKFNLPSMRKLWKELGGYDALVEYNECAIRQFSSKWELFKKTDDDYLKFLRNQSAEVGINLRHIDFDRYRQDVYRWYLIHPYGCIDRFVDDFKKDLSIFGFDINLDFEGKSILEKLISGMEGAGIRTSVDQNKLSLDVYYRRCRNYVTHKLDGDEKRKIDKLFDAINKNEVFAFYPSLTDALSASNVFSFDDYTLCTANLKNICDILTTDVFESIDWSKFRISDTELGKSLNKFGNREDRIRQAIKGYIKSNYGIIVNDDIVNIINNPK